MSELYQREIEREGEKEREKERERERKKEREREREREMKKIAKSKLSILCLLFFARRNSTAEVFDGGP
jgi:hypothetical protein